MSFSYVSFDLLGVQPQGVFLFLVTFPDKFRILAPDWFRASPYASRGARAVGTTERMMRQGKEVLEAVQESAFGGLF